MSGAKEPKDLSPDREVEESVTILDTSDVPATAKARARLEEELKHRAVI